MTAHEFVLITRLDPERKQRVVFAGDLPSFIAADLPTNGDPLEIHGMGFGTRYELVAFQ